jgi:hypothetical protein
MVQDGPVMEGPLPADLRVGLRRSASHLRAGVNDWLDRDLPAMMTPVEACFVVGCGNSGTSLVAARLGLHPAIFAVPRETRVFRPSRRLRHARDRLGRWFAEAERVGASLLVEKTPKHVHNVHRIRRLLPEARVIVVLRNPFDTALSLKKRSGRLGPGIERWLLDNAAAHDLPEDARTIRVRYERLTAAPSVEFGRLLEFLGLDWHDAILASRETGYGSLARPRSTTELRARQVAEPVRSNSGQWRSELTPSEIAQVRRRTAPLWRALGGDPETGDWAAP